MTLFAAGDSNASKIIDDERRTLLIDPELRLFAVVNRLKASNTDAIAVSSMLDTLHRILKANHLLIHRYIADPSYYNRIRASLFLELAIRQAHRRARHTYKNHGLKPKLAPQLVVMVLSDHDALMTLGPAGGIYQVRDNVGRLLTADNAIGTDIVTGASEAAMVRKPRPRKAPRPGKVKLIHIEVAPGDQYLLASDGMADYLGKGGILAEFSYRGTPDAIIRALIKQAPIETEAKPKVASAIYVSFSEDEADDYKRLSEQIPDLRRFTVFRRLGNYDIIKIIRMMSATDYAKGKSIEFDPDKDERIYICVSGRFSVHSRGRRIFHIVPGAIVGPAGLVSSFPRKCTVVAEEDSRMLFMSSETFRTLRSNEPVASTKFLWGLSRALSVSIRKAAEIMAMDPNRLSVQPTKPKGGLLDEPIKLERDETKGGYIYIEPKTSPSSKTSLSSKSSSGTSRSKSRSKSGRSAAGQSSADKR